MNKGAPTRAAAAYCLQQVLQHERSLNQAMPEAVQKFNLQGADKGLAQAIVYGVLRDLPALEWIIAQLLDKPLKRKVRIVHYLLLVGLQQLHNMRTASHAAVAETVAATRLLKQQGLKNLVNAILRGYQRQHESLAHALAQQPDKQHGHPAWLINRLQAAYPERWSDLVEANNTQAPMWLRVNARHHSAATYQTLLSDAGIDSSMETASPQAIRLHSPCDVSLLPGFTEGWVSVQDSAAQHAARLLNPAPGARVLDACAAPGGKTAHLLELYDIDLTAIDIDNERLQRVQENLQRLRLEAHCVQGDAAAPETWWSGELFDHILLDAPCSATGVIRRHPDIKWLRRDADISALVALQAEILAAQWTLLKPGGTLLYATCSVLPDENKRQINAFVAATGDAELLPLAEQHTASDWQLLPGENDGDGFYYALLGKKG
ncbi:16S rRNA (cytosine(967)-C(5))-methyltransferase RsmB [Aliidiomarina sp. Khilg15.8]